MRNSYCQFGIGTSGLDADVADLGSLLHFLVTRRGAKRIALLGHSTECQVIVHFMRTAAVGLSRLVKLAVLQAPVSDREAGSLRLSCTTSTVYAVGFQVL